MGWHLSSAETLFASVILAARGARELANQVEGISWGGGRPRYCQLGIGSVSSVWFAAVSRTLPHWEHVILLDDTIDRGSWTEAISSKAENVELFFGSISDFPASCHVVSVSADHPAVTVEGIQQLYAPVDIAFLVFRRLCEEDNVDVFYCEFLAFSFNWTVCGVEDLGATVCVEDVCICRLHPVSLVDVFVPSEGCSTPAFSQWGQDDFLHLNLFQGRRNGFYLDLGAGPPFDGSNTAFFDKCLHWTGVCVEPNPHVHWQLRLYRGCTIVPSCVSSRTEMASFGFMAEAAHAKRVGGDEVVHSRFKSLCHTPAEILRASGVRGGHVHYMSVDLEGSEAEVLVNLLPIVEPDVVTVEQGLRTSVALDSIFLPFGYVKVACLGKDAVYALPGVLLHANFPWIWPRRTVVGDWSREWQLGFVWRDL